MSPAEQLFDATIRVEQIIWIPGAVADFEATPDVFRDEFVDNIAGRDEADIFGQLPALARFAGEYPEADEVAEALLTTPGFLVQAATPVRKYHGDGSATFSWGAYRICWLYAPSEADITPVVIAWAEKQQEQMKAKAAA